MNRPVSPKQLDLVEEVSREELLIQSLPPHIDPASPAFKADLEKIDRIERENAEHSEEQSLTTHADGEVCLVPNQETILAWRDKSTGDLWFKQVSWPDEDSVIKVSEPLIPQFMDQLCDLIGIASFGERR